MRTHKDRIKKMFSLGSNTFTRKSGWRPGRTRWVQPGIPLIYFSKCMSLPLWAIRSCSPVIINTRVSGSKGVHSAFQKSQGTQWLKVSSRTSLAVLGPVNYIHQKGLLIFFLFFFLIWNAHYWQNRTSTWWQMEVACCL